MAGFGLSKVSGVLQFFTEPKKKKKLLGERNLGILVQLPRSDPFPLSFLSTFSKIPVKKHKIRDYLAGMQAKSMVSSNADV